MRAATAIRDDNYSDPCRRCGHSRANHGEAPKRYVSLGGCESGLEYDDSIAPGACFCGCAGFVE